jgi:hypothetical protein
MNARLSNQFASRAPADATNGSGFRHADTPLTSQYAYEIK